MACVETHRGTGKGPRNLHFQHDLTAVHIDLLAVRVLDCRVIAVDPDVLHELRCETAFPYAACRGKRQDTSAGQVLERNEWQKKPNQPGGFDTYQRPARRYDILSCKTVSCCSGGISTSTENKAKDGGHQHPCSVQITYLGCKLILTVSPTKYPNTR